MKAILRRTLLPAFIATASISAFPAGATSAEDSADTAAVLEANRSILDAVMKSHPEGFRNLTHEKLRVLAPGGRLETREMAIKGLGTVVGDLTFSGEEVIVVGDTAILSGKMEGDAEMQPFGKLPPMKYIATFVRTKDGWRMLSRAITPCAAVAIEKEVC